MQPSSLEQRRGRLRRILPALILAAFLPIATAVLAQSAAGVAVDFDEIAPGVYVHEGAVAEMSARNHGAIANIGFIVGDESVAVIDSGGSAAEAEAILAAIGAATDKPIRFLIDTHMHPDHVFGNAVFKRAGARIIAHENLPNALAARAETYRQTNRRALGEDLMRAVEIVLPDETVADTRKIDLGNRVLTLRAWPTAHTNNDLTVFDETTGTLFAGDLVFVDHVPIIDGSLKGWMAAIEALKKIPAERVVPGHGPASAPWPTALARQSHYFEVLAKDVRAAIAAGETLADTAQTAAQSEAENWELFDVYNARNATTAFAELEWE